MKNQIEAVFEKAATVVQDLRDPECKRLCDELTQLSWKIIKSQSFKWEIDRDLFNQARSITTMFPHLNSRIYEVYSLHRLNSLLRDENRSSVSDTFDLFREEQLMSPTRPSLIFQGLLDCKLNGLKSAQYYFLRANQEYINDSIVTPFFAYSRSISPFASLSGIGNCSLSVDKNNGDGKTWFLVAANSHYIAKFLKNYVEKLAGYIQDEYLHVHWILDESDAAYDITAEDAIRYAKSLLGGNLQYTKECIPKFRDKRSYFASSRFLFAREKIGTTGRLIITDIDYEMYRDFGDFIEYCREYDVTLQSKPYGLQSYFPWLKVLAGTVVVQNSPIGRSFLDVFNYCFNRVFVPNGFNWGIDQNILCSIADEIESIGCLGNSLSISNPFKVPYELKKSI